MTKMQAWVEARKRHGLSHAEVQMARELGMNPTRVTRNQNRTRHTPDIPAALTYAVFEPKRWNYLSIIMEWALYPKPIYCNPDSMPENSRVDVILGVDINSAHELDERPCFSSIMAAGFVQILADQIEWYFLTLPYLRYG